MDDFSFLDGPASVVAPRLLGCELIRTLDGQELRARIVETEAYDQTDAASHSYKGRTPRTEVMFGPSGHIYVYFTYGMHYCMNIVTGPIGLGAAVLIRALEPLEGAEIMLRNRGGVSRGIDNATNGPAKLCQALVIDKTMNGHDLRAQPLSLLIRPQISDSAITVTTRVGISQAADVPWRFYLTGNPFVSRT